MEASEIAAIVAAVACAVLVVGLLFVLSSLTRTLSVLRETVEELRQETRVLVADVRGVVNQANVELAKVDGVLDTAESISGTIDSASRLAYLAFSNPVIKAVAAGTGAVRAARKLRKSD